MRKLTAILCLTLAVLLVTATEGLALPPCPEDQGERYHNCYGTYVGDDGKKYVGEFKNDLSHGYGVEYAADGTAESQGYWENDELVRSTKQVVKKQVATASQQAEILFWETIKNSTRAEDFLAYLTEFPNGVFTALAKLKLKSLEPKQDKKRSETEQKQQAKLARKKAEAERQRIAEEKARNLPKAKAEAEKKRLAKLARKKAEEEEFERKVKEKFMNAGMLEPPCDNYYRRGGGGGGGFGRYW